MSFLRLTLLSFVTVLAITACGRDEDSSAAAPDSGAVNELLAYVPADTPYVFANMEPVPDEVIDTFLERMQPVLDSMQAQLTRAREELESGPMDAGDPGARLAHALIQELDGKVSRTGLESLGLDLASRKVVYGESVFPVIRLGLSDPSALRATIQRVLDRAGIQAPELEHQGVSYWRLGHEDTPNEPVALYVSILDDHLALSVFPTLEEADFLPSFLGLERPPESDAQARLAELNRARDYSPYGSGIVDIHRLADELIQPGTPASRLLAASGEFDPETLAGVCATEIHEIIDNAPLMTMGLLELTTQAWAFQYRLETTKSLAGQLMGLVSEIPMADALSERILEFAFGMRFGPVRDFLREKTQAIVEDPYECEHLRDLNHSATQSLAQLDQPMPPFVNNFLGLRISLSEFLLGRGTIPENARGHLAVHVEQPEMFIGMAQMFLPDLSGLEIRPGEDPVRLPESLVPAPGIEAWAAMSTDAIGLAVGGGEQQALPAFLEAKPGPEGVFLSAVYDLDAYLEYIDELSERYAPDVQDDEESLQSQGARELHETMMAAYREMADRSYTTLRFTAEGFEMENRLTFK